VPRRLRAVSVVLALGFVACGKEAAEQRAVKGETVYVRECARCHMVDGSGVAGVFPNLAGNPIVTLESPEPAIAVVLEGREAMPAFEGTLPLQKLAEVLTYIRSAWGHDASPVTPAQAK
jgi:alcohol dehydrogenase (quinone), cytochrome c subunit